MDIYPECGRVEDSLQYRSLGPRVEAGSGIRGYSRYAHPGFISPAVSCSGAGLSLARSTSHPSLRTLSSNMFIAAEAESAAVTCSVTRDSLRVCTSLTGSGPLDAGGLLGLVLGEHEVAAHG